MNLKKGFTLVELLVVMAIISMLSSVVFGSVQDGRKKAYNSALAQELKQMVYEVQIKYANTNNMNNLLECSSGIINKRFLEINIKYYRLGLTVTGSRLCVNEDYRIWYRTKTNKYHCIDDTGNYYYGPTQPTTMDCPR